MTYSLAVDYSASEITSVAAIKARADLDSATSALADADAKLEQARSGVLSGDSTVTPTKYGNAVTGLEFAELALRGAESRSKIAASRVVSADVEVAELVAAIVASALPYVSVVVSNSAGFRPEAVGHGSPVLVIAQTIATKHDEAGYVATSFPWDSAQYGLTLALHRQAAGTAPLDFSSIYDALSADGARVSVNRGEPAQTSVSGDVAVDRLELDVHSIYPALPNLAGVDVLSAARDFDPSDLVVRLINRIAWSHGATLTPHAEAISTDVNGRKSGEVTVTSRIRVHCSGLDLGEIADAVRTVASQTPGQPFPYLGRCTAAEVTKIETPAGIFMATLRVTFSYSD